MNTMNSEKPENDEMQNGPQTSLPANKEHAVDLARRRVDARKIQNLGIRRKPSSYLLQTHGQTTPIWNAEVNPDEWSILYELARPH